MAVSTANGRGYSGRKGNKFKALRLFEYGEYGYS
jgi:hypothetical protein